MHKNAFIDKGFWKIMVWLCFEKRFERQHDHRVKSREIDCIFTVFTILYHVDFTVFFKNTWHKHTPLKSL